VIAERGMVDPGGEAGERAGLPQPVDPPLDRRRRERDMAPDVVVRAAPVFDQQRKNLTIYIVHAQEC
jgi:hypothetical protein